MREDGGIYMSKQGQGVYRVVLLTLPKNFRMWGR